MQHTIRVTNDSVEVLVQRESYLDAIGSSIPTAVIDDIIAFSEDAKTPDWYSGLEDWYEMPEKDGLEKRAEAMARMWLENEDNIKRAAKHVGRHVAPVERSLLKASGFCRFKAMSDQSSWSLHKRPGIDHEQQVMVFIALEDLGPRNGFPFELSRGQDVSVDGHTNLIVPPTGGGRAICFGLRI